MFTMFFSHLTTSIADIEIQLSKVGIPRNGAAKDFIGYMKYLEEVETSKSTGKKTSENGEETYQNKLGESLMLNVEGGNMQESRAEKFVKSLGWTNLHYFAEWKANMKVMELSTYDDRKHRVSNRRGERFVVMSGLTWNKQSRSKERDWAATVAAITLETAIVEKYREKLLRMCNGAYELRKEMLEYFSSITIGHYETHPSTGEIIKNRSWEFPDGYKLPVDVDASGDSGDKTGITGTTGKAGGTSTTGHTSMTGRYNPEAMRKELHKVNPIIVTSKRRKESVQSQIRNLTKNKYLWSSNSKASNGSLETLAYHCIVTLWRVSYNSICLLDRNAYMFREVRRLTWTSTDSTFQCGAGRVQKE